MCNSGKKLFNFSVKIIIARLKISDLERLTYYVKDFKLTYYELSNDYIYLVKQIHEQQQDSRSSDSGQDDDPQRNDVRFDGQVPGDDLCEHLIAPNLGEFTFRLANVLELGDFC